MDEGACFWSQVVDASSGGRQGDGMSPALIPAPEPYDLIMHVNWCALSGDGTLDPVTYREMESRASGTHSDSRITSLL